MASEKKRQRDSGEPGGGAGRRDEDVGGSGVYPASGEHPRAAELRTQGEWGQKLGGQVGGSSELTVPVYSLPSDSSNLNSMVRAA